MKAEEESRLSSQSREADARGERSQAEGELKCDQCGGWRAR